MAICSVWATENDLCDICSDYDAAVDFTPYLQAASEVLYHLSAQQFPGICDITIEPCSNRTSASDLPNLMFRDRLPWLACGCLVYRDDCSCAGDPILSLAPTPVTEITEITTSDGVLDDSAYELLGNSVIRRIDGDNWPCCDSDFSVAFSYGREPPQLGIQAAAILACELYLSCQPEDVAKRCRLPRNVVSVSRQGVSIVIANAANLFQRIPGQPFKTGLWEIDLFLSSMNPYGNTTQSVVLSPDIPEIGRRIGP